MATTKNPTRKKVPHLAKGLPSAAHREGYKLAIAMLTEFEERSPDIVHTASLEWGSKQDGEISVYREKPQDNVLMRYLDRALERNDREILEGFTAIITDCLTISGAPDASFYEKLVKQGRYLGVPSALQVEAFNRAASAGGAA